MVFWKTAVVSFCKKKNVYFRDNVVKKVQNLSLFVSILTLLRIPPLSCTEGPSNLWSFTFSIHLNTPMVENWSILTGCELALHFRKHHWNWPPACRPKKIQHDHFTGQPSKWWDSTGCGYDCVVTTRKDKYLILIRNCIWFCYDTQKYDCIITILLSCQIVNIL